MSRYFDMDSFLAEQTRCPVVFNSGCTGLGKEMDKMCQTRDLPMGEEVELPFWLVPKLFEQNMVGPRCRTASTSACGRWWRRSHGTCP